MPYDVNTATMRELADAIDKDRGHAKSLVTRLLRRAADELDRARRAEHRRGCGAQ